MILSRTEPFEVESFPKHRTGGTEMNLQLLMAAGVLTELYDLLEGYAPSWYSQQHHERAEAALRVLNQR